MEQVCDIPASPLAAVYKTLEAEPFRQTGRGAILSYHLRNSAPGYSNVDGLSDVSCLP